MKVFVFHGDRGIKNYIMNSFNKEYGILTVDYCKYTDGEICDYLSSQKEFLSDLFDENKVVLIEESAFDELYFLKLIELNRFSFTEKYFIKDNDNVYNISSVVKIKSIIENKILQHL
jgi:hypothetical protein